MKAATATKRKPRTSLKQQELDREIAYLRQQVGREISRHTSGINLNLGNITEEYVPELQNLRSRVGVYERMANDPNIHGQLRAIWMTMVSGVRWKVEGGTPEMRELVEANLLCRGPSKFWCSSSWLDRMNESLGMLVYGFSMFGKTRAVVDGKVIFSDLKWLHPRSVDDDGWLMDDADNLLGVRRTYQKASGQQMMREETDASELFMLTWGRRGPNWEGNSFIRPMYRPWKLGEMAEKIDIIDLQNRGVGIPMAKLSGTGGQKERDTLVSILQSLRGGSKERAYIVLQNDEEVSFLTSAGQAKDAQPTLAHHRASMVKAGGQEYFEQGNTATGSRAGASALATGFFVNVDGIRVILEDQINNGIGPMPGLVQELIDLNYDDVDDYPRIVGSRVSPQEQLDNIPLVYDGIAKGGIPPHLKLTNDLLRRLGYEEMSDEEWEEAMARKTISPAVGGPGRPNEAGPDEEGRDDTEGRRLNMTEKKTANIGGNLRPRSPASWRWRQLTAG